MVFATRLRRLLSAVSLTAVATLALASATFAQSNNAPFALKNGDRVVFYGDSITDQRMYTLLTEEYIATRFPQLDIRFTHSGWGGDRVSGGGGGPIDLRLDRDVTPYKPTVVTIMLGMNDASYRAFDEAIFQTYAKGYQHLSQKLKKDNPGVRLTFIQPSPYDDVTRAPGFEGGYNAVLLRYGNYLADLSRTERASIANLNGPVVDMLKKANEKDNAVAQKIIPDRVHPGWGGHLIMAESLLKSWNAPSLVSSVTVNAKAATATTENATVSGIRIGSDGSVTWTSIEGSLPFPISAPDPRNADSYDLALKSSDFIEALDREILTVSDLSAANYTLKIDDQEIGTFSKEQLAAGINLATLNTPMLRQAALVAQLTQLRSNLHNTRWRDVQVPQANSKALQKSLPSILKGMDSADEQMHKARYTAAQPTAHTFALVPKI